MHLLLQTLIIFYITLLTLLFVFQRRLIYHPETTIHPPGEYGLQDFSETFINTTDNISLQLWYRPANAGFPTIVYYHGNAYHLGNRAAIYTTLASKGFGVLALSYRGYGKSGGKPSERGIYTDARAAIAFLTDQQKIPLSRILLFGESLGTGVAVQMASEYAVAGLILEAPYMSVAARAAEMYRFIPVRFLIRDRYDSLGKIAKVKAPLLLFHGERDGVIPIAHGRKLFDTATSVKRAYYFPEFAHNDFDSGVISSHVLDFAEELKLIIR